MNKIISILLVGLLGFLGCSGSDAGTSAVTVQAFGVIDEGGLSVTAYVMDQEENLSSDAMLTINGEPMNIGFFFAEDVNMDQDDDIPDATDPTVKGVPSEVYHPYYFLDLLYVNDEETVDFIAKGMMGETIYSSSVVVPEMIRITEPSADDALAAGEPVVVKWEGGAPCSQFHVSYYRGSDAEIFSSETIQGSTNFIMPAHWIDEGWGVIFVDGCVTDDENDQKVKGRGVTIRVKGAMFIEVAEGNQVVAQRHYSHRCALKCDSYWNGCYARCAKIQPNAWAIATCQRYARKHKPLCKAQVCTRCMFCQ